MLTNFISDTRILYILMTVVTVALCGGLLAIFKKFLPKDQGREFAFNGKLSAGKMRGAGLLFVIAFVCWLAFRKIAARKADVVGTKNRKATKMALKRLNLAETFLKQNLYTAFYEELHKALLGFISDKLNISLADLSRDRIAESLK